MLVNNAELQFFFSKNGKQKFVLFLPLQLKTYPRFSNLVTATNTNAYQQHLSTQKCK